MQTYKWYDTLPAITWFTFKLILFYREASVFGRLRRTKQKRRSLKIPLSDKSACQFCLVLFPFGNLPTNNVVPTLFFSGLTYPVLFSSSDRFLPTCATWSVSRQRRCIMSQRFARWQTTWGHFGQLEKTVICHHGFRADPRRPSQP